MNALALGLGAVLRAAVLAAAAAWLAVGIGGPLAALAAAAGIGLGCALSAAADRLQLGAWVQGLAALAGLLAALLLGEALVHDAGVARLGALRALHLREGLLWAAAAASSVWGLRALTRGGPAAGLLEPALATACIALPLAAHRAGRWHRPFEIGDWIAARGLDPSATLHGVGALAAVAVGLLLWRTGRGGIAALALLCGIGGGAWWAAQRLELAAPAPAAELGLTGAAGERGRAGTDARGAAGGESRPTAGLEALRDEYSARGGDAPVAVIALEDDYAPPSGVWYLRQRVLDRWDGRRLRPRRADTGAASLALRHFPVSRRALHVPGAPELRRDVRARVGLLVAHPEPFALDSPAWIEPVENPAPERFVRTYRALSRAPAGPPSTWLGRRSPRVAAAAGDEPRAPQDPRYRALAERIVAELAPAHRGDPYARALAIARFLEREATYSRSSRHAAAPDPTASFLFGSRVGYCVHFAHAAALLLRALDLPARVAIGYAVPDRVRGGTTSLLVQGSHAHAWAELLLEGPGWVVVDPSPARALDAAAPAPDPELQRRLGALLRRPAPPRTLARAPLERHAMVYTNAGALLLAALWGGALARRAARRAGLYALPRRRALRAGYRQALEDLAREGRCRRYGEAPERFAARSDSPALAALAREVWRTEAGAVPPPRAWTRARLRELRARRPRLRRALSALHPLSPRVDPARRNP